MVFASAWGGVTRFWASPVDTLCTYCLYSWSDLYTIPPEVTLSKIDPVEIEFGFGDAKFFGGWFLAKGGELCAGDLEVRFGSLDFLLCICNLRAKISVIKLSEGLTCPYLVVRRDEDFLDDPLQWRVDVDLLARLDDALSQHDIIDLDQRQDQ